MEKANELTKKLKIASESKYLESKFSTSDESPKNRLIHAHPSERGNTSSPTDSHNFEILNSGSAESQKKSKLEKSLKNSNLFESYKDASASTMSKFSDYKTINSDDATGEIENGTAEFKRLFAEHKTALYQSDSTSSRTSHNIPSESPKKTELPKSNKFTKKFTREGSLTSTPNKVSNLKTLISNKETRDIGLFYSLFTKPEITSSQSDNSNSKNSHLVLTAPSKKSKASELDRKSESFELDRLTTSSKLDKESKSSELDRRTKLSEFARKSKSSQLERKAKSSELDRKAKPSEIDRKAISSGLEGKPIPRELNRKSKLSELDRKSKSHKSLKGTESSEPPIMLELLKSLQDMKLPETNVIDKAIISEDATVLMQSKNLALFSPDSKKDLELYFSLFKRNNTTLSPRESSDSGTLTPDSDDNEFKASSDPSKSLKNSNLPEQYMKSDSYKLSENFNVSEQSENIKLFEPSKNSKLTIRSAESKLSEPALRSKLPKASERSKLQNSPVKSEMSDQSMTLKLSDHSVRSKLSHLSVRSKLSNQSVGLRLSNHSIRSKLPDPSVRSKMPDPSVRSKVSDSSVRSKVSDSSVRSKVSDSSVRSKVSDSSMRSKLSDPSKSSKFSNSTVKSNFLDSSVKSNFLDSSVKSNFLNSSVRSKLPKPSSSGSKLPYPSVRSNLNQQCGESDKVLEGSIQCTKSNSQQCMTDSKLKQFVLSRRSYFLDLKANAKRVKTFMDQVAVLKQTCRDDPKVIKSHWKNGDVSDWLKLLYYWDLVKEEINMIIETIHVLFDSNENILMTSEEFHDFMKNILCVFRDILELICTCQNGLSKYTRFCSSHDVFIFLNHAITFELNVSSLFKKLRTESEQFTIFKKNENS